MSAKRHVEQWTIEAVKADANSAAAEAVQSLSSAGDAAAMARSPKVANLGFCDMAMFLFGMDLHVHAQFQCGVCASLSVVGSVFFRRV